MKRWVLIAAMVITGIGWTGAGSAQAAVGRKHLGLGNHLVIKKLERKVKKLKKLGKKGTHKGKHHGKA
jgi:hypothetical protein